MPVVPVHSWQCVWFSMWLGRAGRGFLGSSFQVLKDQRCVFRKGKRDFPCLISPCSPVKHFQTSGGDASWEFCLVSLGEAPLSLKLFCSFCRGRKVGFAQPSLGKSRVWSQLWMRFVVKGRMESSSGAFPFGRANKSGLWSPSPCTCSGEFSPVWTVYFSLSGTEIWMSVCCSCQYI